MEMYPLKFKAIYKQRIWGGQKLREFFGKNLPADEKIGESWELADLPDDKSIIANGEFAGHTLNSVIAEYPKEMTGDENFSGAFPLLIKFLDAEDILSVQVHPDSATCERMGKGDPKTECWYIIYAADNAVIYKGLKKGVRKSDFAEAIRKGSVAELLEKVAVEAGQCHYLPAGTAHSIGAGLLIAEIQTPSDTTYRVFDWNRVDDKGQSRPLHIQEAIESIHFDASGDELSVTTAGRLVDSPFFTIDKRFQPQGSEISFSGGQMIILIILSGQGIIGDIYKEGVNFGAGETILIPYAYESKMLFGDNTEYLAISV